MPVQVKLDAYVLPEDHTVYKFFPGEGYKFYDAILESKIAIIDVRGLEKLEGHPNEWDDDEVLDVISQDRVDRAIQAGGEKPKRLVHSPGDKLSQTILYGLLFEAEKGDLIVMPQRGYASTVWIGQLADDEIATIDVKGEGGSYTYFGRRVKWVGSISKRGFSSDLVDLLQTPVAFFDIGQSNYDQVYRAAFDNYVHDNQFVATFRTAKDTFTPKDSFVTSVWLELLEVLEQARENEDDLPADASIFDLVITSDIDEGNRDDLSISVQSPGWFRIRSVVASPLASLALFALAVQGISYDDARAATTTAIVVRGADDSCMGDVDQSVRAYIELLGEKRWEEACRLAKQADVGAKLKADASVRQVAKKEDN